MVVEADESVSPQVMMEKLMKVCGDVVNNPSPASMSALLFP